VLEFFSKLSPCLVGMEACATSHTGLASSRSLATMCGLCPQAT
jgi:hypothetical protein